MATIEQLTRDIAAAVASSAETHDDEHLDVQARVNELIRRVDIWEVPDLSGTAAQNTSALNTAVVESASTGRPIHLPLGTFQYDGTFQAQATNTNGTAPSIFGMGTRGTWLVCTDNTAPLMYHGGFGGTVSRFRIQHLGENPDGTYGDGLVFRKSAYNRYLHLQIDNCRRNVTVDQADVADPGEGGGGTGNWFFSCYACNVNVNRYSESGWFLHAFGGRSTGNVIDNTYVQNKATDGSARSSTGRPVTLFQNDETTFNQLNIEDHAGTGIALLHNSGGVVVINGLHFERVTLDNWQSKYVEAYGNASLVINGFNVAFCDVAGTNSGGYSSLASANEGGRVHINGASMNHLSRTRTSVDVPLYRVAAGATAASIEYTYEVELLHVSTPTTFDGDAPSTAAAAIKRVGDNFYNVSALGGAAGTDHSAARIYSGSDQAITAFTSTQATLASTDFNVGLDVATNANAITIPAGKAGLYKVDAAVWFQGGTSGQRNVAIRKNGAAVVQGGTVGVECRPNCGGVIELAAGDVLTMYVYAEAAVTLKSFGDMDVSMSAARMGDAA